MSSPSRATIPPPSDRAIRPCGGNRPRGFGIFGETKDAISGFGETMAKRLMRLASGLWRFRRPRCQRAAHRVPAVQSPILRFSLRDVWIALAATVVSCLQ